VRQHEGFIRLYSEAGIGTTIRIYLPVIDQKLNQKEAEASAEPVLRRIRGDPCREDDETIRISPARILSRAGYEVLSASNGEEAVAVYEANASRIDLLLFDAVMPKASGLEAYERISA